MNPKHPTVVSTGPRTTEGKAICATNAIKHGLRSERAVIPGIGETEEQWHDFRLAVIQSLQPAPGLEMLLADRAASLLWRLQRLTGYETGLIQTRIQRILQPYPKSRFTQRPICPTYQEEWTQADRSYQQAQAKVRLLQQVLAWMPRFCQSVEERSEAESIPAEVACAIYACLSHPKSNRYPTTWRVQADDQFEPSKAGIPCWEQEADWSIQIVQDHLHLASQQTGRTRDQIVQTASDYAQKELQEAKQTARSSQRQREAVERPVQQMQARQIARSVLPDEKTTAKIVRYESHLQKQLTSTLHQLERLQAQRAGMLIPPPLALDVVIE